MVARVTKRQRQERDALKRLPQELLNELRAVSIPEHYTGVTNWRERWERRDYKRLNSWRIAWGFIRHSWEYQEDWAFYVQRRRWADNGLIPAYPPDTTDWAKRYHLRYAPDPALNAFEVDENPFRSVHEPNQSFYRGPGEVKVVLLSHQAMFMIDLSRPIAPQLADAKRRLPPRPRARHRLRFDKYPEYVCALDGKAAGASIAAIGSVLHPNLEPETRKLRVENYLDAAKALASNGYDLIERADKA